MAQASMKFEVAMGPEMLWQAIGSFYSFGQGLPGVETLKSEDGKSTQRKFKVPAGEIVEKVENVSESERLYTYSVSGPSGAPMNYASTVRIRDKGNGRSEVEWTSDVDSAALAANPGAQWVENAYRMGFDSLRKMFGTP